MSCIKLWLIFFKEIDSIDVQTGRIDKFGKGFQQKIYLKEIHELFFLGEGNYSERVLIVYSGIRKKYEERVYQEN